MKYSWQFDPLEPDKPVELTCDGVVIATTSLNNAKELADKLNSQADLYEACKEVRDNSVLQKQGNGFYILRLKYSSWQNVCGAIAKVEGK